MGDTRSVPRPAQVHNVEHTNAVALWMASALLVAAMPGALVGAVIASLVWRFTRPDTVTRWLFAGVGAATAAALRSTVAIAWPWRAMLHTLIPSWADGLSVHVVAASVPVEILAGPAALVLFQAGTSLWRGTIHGQDWARYHAMVSRKKALERHWPGPSAWSAGDSSSVGMIHLGANAEDGRPFDIGADELAQHIFVPGASGTGKTTTLVTLADGALANGYGVIIIDCKGSGLGGEARRLAARHELPFTAVDPKDKKSVGYDPCSGDAAAVANKLIGAFQFTGEAEIYKHVAMEVIPIICRALEASGTPVTLDNIYEALDRGGLGRLARRDGADAYRSRLEDLEDSGGVGAAGYAGLQRRLGALMEGTFGELFRKRPALNWQRQLKEPRVTYLSLSATAAGEDVELFGRVITQDLKQVCDERMRALDKGKDVIPVLIIYDEFAALREATQIVDLLLQARQAKAPLIVATQFLPEEIPILRPVMSAGILICHRLEAEDAEKVSAQFGTHTVPLLTAQVDFEVGTSEKGSVRWVEEYNMHPNDLKELPVGVAAVLARPTQRRAVVRINRLT
jgi:hypothetical protein